MSQSSLHSHQGAIESLSVAVLCFLVEPIHLMLELRPESVIPPPTFTPRRFPAESEDPALNPPARFVAVRIPSGRVGLCTTFGSTEGRVMSELSNDLVCRIIMMNRCLSLSTARIECVIF